MEQHIFAEGDLVVSLWTETRTHSGGEYLGYAATGKTVSNDGMSMYRIANGKITELTLLSDWRPWFRSVGVLPPE